MLLSYIILAISVSIDSFGIGITYGIKKTHIYTISKIIMFIISFIITFIAVNLGAILSKYISYGLANFISSAVLVCMGFWVAYKAIRKKEAIASNLDTLQKIEWKDAIYLSFILSIDAICVGVCGGAMGYSPFIFSLLATTFQLIFLCLGKFLGEKITLISFIPENTWSILSGIMLVCVGISRMIL
jgi:putative Mn2+ efflux pump MntP